LTLHAGAMPIFIKLELKKNNGEHINHLVKWTSFVDDNKLDDDSSARNVLGAALVQVNPLINAV
jgi:hypothetical protein